MSADSFIQAPPPVIDLHRAPPVSRVRRAGSHDREPLPAMFIMGNRLDNIRESDALTIVRLFAAHPNEGPARQILFTNVHSMYLAYHNRKFQQTVNAADLVLPDGSGLKFAGQVYGTPVLENLNGTDFTPKVLEIGQQEQWTVYLLGSKPGVIEFCRDRISSAFPALRIVGSRHGYFSDAEENAIVDEINAVQPNILLVALGSPLQEMWIARNAGRLNTGACLAVGGLFDFISGTRRRAPFLIRKLGMEWIFRFLQDPKAKWNRIFIEIPWFILHVLARAWKVRLAMSPNEIAR